MSRTVSLNSIIPLREQLTQHPVYGAVRSITDLRLFMEHHIFSVWDFMSLLKFLQGNLAPSSQPWAPTGNPAVRRFVNDIVLEEETDLGLPDSDGNPTYASHFELYAQAMREIGADPEPANTLATGASKFGFKDALENAGDDIPVASRDFMCSTFDFIASSKSHVVAAAFALGREHVIPSMFRSLLRDMEISQDQAPSFHYYLERHIHLDEDHHGPLSLLMLNELCGGNEKKIAEAETASCLALQARIKFWDGVLIALEARPV
ncbi:MAG: DUF3050 domain-containing protein [Magnetococcales bacterium]|nr:DUF3050 domain-containing protein [Magnetococcales bacterium]